MTTRFLIHILQTVFSSRSETSWFSPLSASFGRHREFPVGKEIKSTLFQLTIVSQCHLRDCCRSLWIIIPLGLKLFIKVVKV